MSKVTDILKEASDNVLTEDTLQEIEKAVNEAVEQKVKERSDIAVQAALNEQDEQYAEKLKNLLESIDKSHCRKLKKIVETIDRDRAIKLKKVVSKYRKELNTEAKKLSNSIVNSISNYMDMYLEEVIPTKDIQEAVNNKRAFNILANFRKTLGVDMALAKESVRAGIIDGKKRLDSTSKRVKKLVSEQKRLEEELTKTKRNLLLTEKTKSFDDKKAKFIKDSLGDKDLNFIKENFDYTARMFDRKKELHLQNVKNDASKKSNLKQLNEETLVLPKKEENRDKNNNPYVQALNHYLQ